MIPKVEFMEKRKTLEQQTQRLEISTEVSKSKARVKLLENTREFNGKVDTVYPDTLYPAKSKTSVVKKWISQGDNPKRSGGADRREVIQLIDWKIVGADVKSVRKVERSVDRDGNMRLEENNLSDTTSSTREPSDILCKILKPQAADKVDNE